MNHNFFLTPFSPIINLFIVTFFLLAKKASCTDPHFLACNPKSCSDGQSISFPFHIQGVQPDYCGYPGFTISCNDKGKPVFNLSNSEYIIHEIYYQNQSLRVSNAAVFGKSPSCTPQIQNISLDDGRFGQSSNSTGVFLLYNCNSTLLSNNGELLNYKVDCPGENETVWTLAMLEDDPLLGSTLDKCGTRVLAPVDVYRGENVGTERMLLLEGGFVLNWTASNCSDCEDSGGKCGFDNATYHFKCFCPDRPHSRRCYSESKKLRLKLGLGLAVGIGVLIITICCIIIRKYSSIHFLSCWRKTRGSQSIEAFLRNYGTLAPKRYSYSELQKMTKNFKEKLGQGGYGSVFKGNLLDGRLVAVKVLKKSKSNGEEFVNEVSSIGRTSHVNIVTLLGFCFEGPKRAIIYEFMSNGSLDKHIYEENLSKAHPKLGWETLYQIAVGIARGLEYLHRGCNTRILHFDIKPHNILLDENLCPKISDFGLAKICPSKESIVSMLGARGTAGYITPEVFCRNFGGVSHKSDVYSYGMLVLEMIGGRKNFRVGVDNTSEIYFPHWIYRRLEIGEELQLQGAGNEVEEQNARKMILASLWCIQTDPSNRPPMSRVVDMLQGSLESLPIPPKPYLSSPPRSPHGSNSNS
ncbi:LEAF RUST 10 DISEASE-RESISTANCE LOCUS RECEPTOR-LIKE PROTEIN KINASE-like 2.1 [Populus nigra]|uniref:LEAF RUST 10 DISEASE-RESISTANCE LOCUS RECEPTOR-LIKE PROTEIN KINASE-like 2.1 n=1 Tax=Populus nigra TaxID=3691 RepID=UPI002B2700EA|nr:LEAF RUST 10 DISEASE-RESISTANCE LOCUS RECEPTOR-LIKE PROTEIN KINASE-like 2.1 [Populus nigra]